MKVWLRFFVLAFVFSVLLVGFLAHLNKTREKSIFLKRIHTTTSLALGTPLANLANRNVLYNRIEKCGSRSLVSITHNIARRNKINVISDNKVYKRWLEGDELTEFQQNISELIPPTFYERHVFYVDFNSYLEKTRPIYINILRDPIERFVSHFNYEKYGDVRQKMFSMTPPKANREHINDCVIKEMEVCNRNNSMMFNMGIYLCGMEKICKKKSRKRIEIAKKHIDEKYSVVGLLEEFENTLRLLERMLPDYFHGAVKMWKGRHRMMEESKTIKQDFLSPEARKKLREDLMVDEYEVYHHAKRKFENLKKQFQIV